MLALSPTSLATVSVPFLSSRNTWLCTRHSATRTRLSLAVVLVFTELTLFLWVAERLQNNPPRFVPQEDLAVKHVLKVLSPFDEKNGGPLKINHVTYIEGRGNLIVQYPGTTDKVKLAASCF